MDTLRVLLRHKFESGETVVVLNDCKEPPKQLSIGESVAGWKDQKPLHYVLDPTTAKELLPVYYEGEVPKMRPWKGAQ